MNNNIPLSTLGTSIGILGNKFPINNSLTNAQNAVLPPMPAFISGKESFFKWNLNLRYSFALLRKIQDDISEKDWNSMIVTISHLWENSSNNILYIINDNIEGLLDFNSLLQIYCKKNNLNKQIAKFVILDYKRKNHLKSSLIILISLLLGDLEDLKKDLISKCNL